MIEEDVEEDEDEMITAWKSWWHFYNTETVQNIKGFSLIWKSIIS